MTREQAYKITTTYLKNPNLLKHCLAAEAVMKALYKRLNANQNPEEENTWGIVGLLHDADYEMSKGHPEKHGLLLFQKEPNIPDDIAYAIKAHNFEYTKVLPKTNMDWAIASCDQLTGLIVAASLIHPDKKLASLTSDFIMKRFKEKTFAKGADRDSILRCETQLKIPLDEFIEINLTAMQAIATELGL